MQLQTLLPYLLFDFKGEPDLVKAIEELSAKFTKERENISDYLKDERLASAYVAFYLTTNIPKLEAVFEWMPKAWLDELKDCAFIDVGAGPGTFSIAFREWMGKPIEVQQIETSSIMREQARKIWAGLYPNEPLSQKVTGKKIMFFGHSANEMGPELALRYIKEHDPDHILFIEPGTKDFFPKMINIRDILLRKDYDVLFPCPTSASCPLAKSENDWCHQFVHVRQEGDVERLTQLVKKDRRNLPLIVHAYSRTFKTQNPTSRIVRVFPESKFSFEWDACELNQIEHYQIMRRGLEKSTQKILSETLAGAGVEIEVEKVLEKGKRVKIKSLDYKLL